MIQAQAARGSASTATYGDTPMPARWSATSAAAPCGTTGAAASTSFSVDAAGSGEATGCVDGYGVIDIVQDAAAGMQTVSVRDGRRQTRAISAAR